AGRVGERNLVHLGAIAQHPTCEQGVVGIRFEGENAISDVGEGVGEEPNVCTDVDGNTAARHKFGKDRELRLTRACLLRNAPPVENRRWHQHRKPFGQGQRHQQLLGKAAATSPRRRAAEQRYELAPVVHSIPSSGSASSLGGMSSPSALAVLRLIRSTPPPPHARRMRNLRNLLHPHATKPTETTRSARPLPARARADRHARRSKPPGYPRLLASARREPIEPAQWPPSPTIRGDAGFSLDARRGRDRITYISYLND